MKSISPRTLNLSKFNTHTPGYECCHAWLLCIGIVIVAKSSYLGKAVDIWAAGVTLYSMMYGKVNVTNATHTATPTFPPAGSIL